MNSSSSLRLTAMRSPRSRGDVAFEFARVEARPDVLGVARLLEVDP